MGDRKRPRLANRVESLQRLLHVGRVSNKGLLRLLTGLRESNALDIANRNNLRTAFLDRARAMGVILQMPLVSGGHFDWFLLNPNTLVANMVAESVELQRVFGEALRRHPCSMQHPWRLVVGYDEFAPGNKFRVDNHRKCFVLSFTFMELDFLESELVWFTPVVVRATKVHECAGGWPAFLRRYLGLHLVGARGVQTAGLGLTLDGEPRVIFARLSNLLTDGDGFRVSLDWKGHASMKPCLKHPNVLRKDSGLAHRQPGFCEIDHATHTDFKPWTTADACDCMQALGQARRQLEAGRITAADFSLIEKATGCGECKGTQSKPIEAVLRRETL